MLFERTRVLPHAILTCNLALEALRDTFRPITEQTGGWLIKIPEFYLEHRGGRALLTTVVVEEGHKQTFYILAAKSEGGKLSLRLDPSTDPVKTRGVKRSIALLAETFRSRHPEVSVHRHNLNDLFDSAPARER